MRRAAIERASRPILGPTNTGKTHFAIERMLAHSSGMIGLPLRLLAREVYDKIVRAEGREPLRRSSPAKRRSSRRTRAISSAPSRRCRSTSARRVPRHRRNPALRRSRARPCLHRPAAARARRRRNAVPRRRHDARRDPALRAAAPISSRARAFPISPIRAHKKLTRLPRRSAIVAFSAEDVYGIAELMRRQRGGAAVVLGALVPRTRNAQVALYQSAMSIFWSRPMPSAWASTWMSIMSRSPRWRNSTALACARCGRKRSARSRAAPAAT